MIYLQLFLNFIQVGLFSIGGGYASIPLIQDRVVDGYGWLSMSEFSDLITIAEMTPGPIAVNCATFVGIRIAGIRGAVAATFGCILPSLFIVSLLTWIYRKYRNLSVIQNIFASLRPAVVALIAGAGLSILINVIWSGASISVSNMNLAGILIFLAAFFILRRFRKNPILVVLCCGLLQLFIGIIGKITNQF